MARPARLVVLHDSARAARVDIDPVDLPGERDPVAEVEPALELGRRSLRAEADLELSRHERRRSKRLVTDELLEVAAKTLLELAPLELGHLHPHARQRSSEALAEEAERLLERALADLVAADGARQPRVEAVQGRVRDGGAQHCIHLPVDLAG